MPADVAILTKRLDRFLQLYGKRETAIETRLAELEAARSIHTSTLETLKRLGKQSASLGAELTAIVEKLAAAQV